MFKSRFMFSSLFMMSTIALQLQVALAGDADANVRADVSNGQAIYNEGKGEATACKGCHGEKALGNDAMGAPRLANIGQIYVLKQLNEFATGKRSGSGAGGTMNEISKALDEQDRRDVAAYMDSFEYEMEPSDLKSLAADGGKVGDPKKGKIIVTKGIKRLVPACEDCHGLSGRAPLIPAVYQQKFVYLVNQLNSFRDGSRANDQTVYKVGVMRGIAKRLTDENIADVAAFLSTAPGITP